MKNRRRKNHQAYPVAMRQGALGLLSKVFQELPRAVRMLESILKIWNMFENGPDF